LALLTSKLAAIRSWASGPLLSTFDPDLSHHAMLSLTRLTWKFHEKKGSHIENEGRISPVKGLALPTLALDSSSFSKGNQI
jgi:hypothetical protein